MPNIEERYIQNLDRMRGPESGGQGLPAEELVVNFFNSSGFQTRLSTSSEDEGNTDIGPKQIIDAVTYYEGKPAMGLQITTSVRKDFREKKLAEMREKPFLRLNEMKTDSLSIPRVLIYLEDAQVKTFQQEPDFNQHPEVALQILDTAIKSLKFDLSQTKNILEQNAVTKLIEMLGQEKKKYIH